MTRIGEILEPGERIVLQHWPRPWVYGMTWSHPKQIRRNDIEGARQNGGKFEVRSIAKSMEFPCPPQLGRRILAAPGREAEGIA